MRALAWVVVSMMVFGCDSDPEEVDSGTPATDAGRVVDAGEGIDAGGGIDAGEPTDAGNGEEDAGEEPERMFGTVSLGQSRQATPPTHALLGSFHSEIVAPRDIMEQVLLCEPDATSGSCVVFFSCTDLGALANAGTITAEVDGTEVASATQDDSGYHSALENGIVAAPGDTVTLSASGDEVPAFSATVTAPGALDVELPTTVARDAPFTITWSTSAATDRMQFSIASPAGVVSCWVDASDETLTVDAELLGMLPAGPGSMSASAFNMEVVTSGEYRVLASVADGVVGAVTLE